MIKKKKQSKVFFVILGLSLMFITMAFILNVIVPFALGLLYMLLALTKLYQLLDITAKFFGGFLFLFVFYKIFEALCSILNMLWKGMNYAWEKIK